MILVIDNYDSFTYNLVQYIGEMKKTIEVIRNDKISLSGIKKISPSFIVISPGPGRPDDAGISKDVIMEFKGKIPILGVCLGHQCIGEVFGGKIIGADRLMHGKTSEIFHNGKFIFKGIPNPFIATRYHSLIIDPSSLPSCLEITARTKEDEIMGIKHRKYPIFGVQFHPESILTIEGKKLLSNFFELCNEG
ncbi:MAG: aminodeoxychorismate/anthranilate synthase component II [bacterium]